LGCGNFKKSGSMVIVYITKQADIINKIIPLFRVRGKNSLCVVRKIWISLIFCKVVNIMNNKLHLTEQGLAQIRKIKAGMNQNRDC
jgi:predicted methyltransferase